jgi:hypothetical protein
MPRWALAALWLGACLVPLSPAAPIPTGANPCLTAGALSSAAQMCVCPAKTVCTGSGCHVGHKPGSAQSKVSDLVHGFHLSGPQKCKDCACFGDTAPTMAASGSLVDSMKNRALQALRMASRLVRGGGRVAPVPKAERELHMFVGIKSAPGEK